jgi:hypothetical protein
MSDTSSIARSLICVHAMKLSSSLIGVQSAVVTCCDSARKVMNGIGHESLPGPL